LTQSKYAENVAEGKIEISIPEVKEWIECIGKTAYEVCNNNRIKLKTSETGQRTGFIIDLMTPQYWVASTGATKKYLDEIPSKLEPTFEKFHKIQKLRKKINCRASIIILLHLS
jgi:hypothetical protein